jgi:hypothetical protein
MRRLCAPLYLVILLGLVAACASPSSGPTVVPAPKVDALSGGPRLAFDSQLIDYGSVPFNRGVKANFQVRNVGDQRLTIKKADVKTVEGC